MMLGWCVHNYYRTTMIFHLFAVCMANLLFFVVFSALEASSARVLQGAQPQQLKTLLVGLRLDEESHSTTLAPSSLDVQASVLHGLATNSTAERGDTQPSRHPH